MMQKFKLLAGTTLVLMASGAFSQVAPPCAGGETDVVDIRALLQGSYLCAKRAPDVWQEFHAVGGALSDWKQGPGHSVDPTEVVGNWSINNARNVIHAYLGGSAFTWRVCRVGPAGPAAVYTLRSPTAGVITGATVVAGTASQPTRPCPP